MCLDKLRLGKGARGIVTVVVDELRHAGRNVLGAQSEERRQDEPSNAMRKKHLKRETMQ